MLSEDASPCRVCDETVGPKGIKCDKCEEWVHQKCAQISDQDYDTITQMDNEYLKFFCPPCSKHSRSLDKDFSASSEAKIEVLIELVKSLQTQNQAIMAIIGNLDLDRKLERKIEQRLQENENEFKERESRENNIILYNLPEPQGPEETYAQEDTKQVNEVFAEIGSDLTGSKLKESVASLKRLGNKTDGKNRPIKISFKDVSPKYSILKKAKNLKGSTKFARVGISPDKTLKERETDRKLRAELKLRQEKGENVKIYRGAIVERRHNTDHSGEGTPGSST